MTPGHEPGAAGRHRLAMRAVIWLPGLFVALGAAAATAHGLYEVAIAAGTPRPITWLYPLITDGLALLAYAATTRLTGSGRRYAWTVVVLAAGLSGLAQASYLAGGVATTPAGLRFGIGAWPAIAAAIVAHLLYLLVADAHDEAQPAASPPPRRRCASVSAPGPPSPPRSSPTCCTCSSPTLTTRPSRRLSHHHPYNAHPPYNPTHHQPPMNSSGRRRQPASRHSRRLNGPSGPRTPPQPGRGHAPPPAPTPPATASCPPSPHSWRSPTWPGEPPPPRSKTSAPNPHPCTSCIPTTTPGPSHESRHESVPATKRLAHQQLP